MGGPLGGGRLHRLALLIGYVVHVLRVRRVPPLIDVRLFTSRSFAASVTVQGLVGPQFGSVVGCGRIPDRTGAGCRWRADDGISL